MRRLTSGPHAACLALWVAASIGSCSRLSGDAAVAAAAPAEAPIRVPTEGLWLEARLEGPGSPVRFELGGLVVGSPYRLDVYDRFRKSERGEDASTKTSLTRPDWRSAEGYAGTHDGFYYSDDPGGIVFLAADDMVRASFETSKADGLGFFRLFVRPVDAAEYERRRRVETMSDGIVPTITSGTPGIAAIAPRYGLFLHGSSIVPAARDLHGAYAAGGDQIFLTAEAGRFIELPEVASTTSFVLNSPRRAEAPEVARRIAAASAILIDGGDQSRYVASWKASAALEAMNEAARRGVPFGGNSAGLAVLGQFVYSAMHEHSLSAEEALGDPYNEWMTLEIQFLRLPGMEGVITESHFSERRREGRLIAFMARLLQDGAVARSRLLGVGVDENTCLVIDASGRALVYGPGSAWLFVPESRPARCVPGRPLDWPGRAVRAIELKGAESGADYGLWKDTRSLPPTRYYGVRDGLLDSSSP